MLLAEFSRFPGLSCIRKSILFIGMATSCKAQCMRLSAVDGDHGKVNDVVFCGTRRAPISNIIFFGGDVQDYKEKMLAHRDNRAFVDWNVESTAELLVSRFSDSHVYVVKPASMLLGTFSSYTNFVESDDIGCPTHTSGQLSWKHLSNLLTNVAHKVSETRTSGAESEEQCLALAPASDKLPLEIVGFSKGCVVLNQLMYDLLEGRQDPETQGFVSRVAKMHWLDGGHNGGSNTWITNEDVIRYLQDTNIRISIHVTPYQMKDQMRPWIGKEKRKFVDRLRKLDIDVTETVHFANEDRDLEKHFNVLKCF